jgi:hypothetical protein
MPSVHEISLPVFFFAEEVSKKFEITVGERRLPLWCAARNQHFSFVDRVSDRSRDPRVETVELEAM